MRFKELGEVKEEVKRCKDLLIQSNVLINRLGEINSELSNILASSDLRLKDIEGAMNIVGSVAVQNTQTPSINKGERNDMYAIVGCVLDALYTHMGSFMRHKFKHGRDEIDILTLSQELHELMTNPTVLGEGDNVDSLAMLIATSLYANTYFYGGRMMTSLPGIVIDELDRRLDRDLSVHYVITYSDGTYSVLNRIVDYTKVANNLNIVSCTTCGVLKYSVAYYVVSFVINREDGNVYVSERILSGQNIFNISISFGGDRVHKPIDEFVDNITKYTLLQGFNEREGSKGISSPSVFENRRDDDMPNSIGIRNSIEMVSTFLSKNFGVLCNNSPCMMDSTNIMYDTELDRILHNVKVNSYNTMPISPLNANQKLADGVIRIMLSYYTNLYIAGNNDAIRPIYSVMPTDDIDKIFKGSEEGIYGPNRLIFNIRLHSGDMWTNSRDVDISRGEPLPIAHTTIGIVRLEAITRVLIVTVKRGGKVYMTQMIGKGNGAYELYKGILDMEKKSSGFKDSSIVDVSKLMNEEYHVFDLGGNPIYYTPTATQQSTVSQDVNEFTNGFKSKGEEIDESLHKFILGDAKKPYVAEVAPNSTPKDNIATAFNKFIVEEMGADEEYRLKIMRNIVGDLSMVTNQRAPRVIELSDDILYSERLRLVSDMVAFFSDKNVYLCGDDLSEPFGGILHHSEAVIRMMGHHPIFIVKDSKMLSRLNYGDDGDLKVTNNRLSQYHANMEGFSQFLFKIINNVTYVLILDRDVYDNLYVRITYVPEGVTSDAFLDELAAMEISGKPMLKFRNTENDSKPEENTVATEVKVEPKLWNKDMSMEEEVEMLNKYFDKDFFNTTAIIVSGIGSDDNMDIIYDSRAHNSEIKDFRTLWDTKIFKRFQMNAISATSLKLHEVKSDWKNTALLVLLHRLINSDNGMRLIKASEEKIPDTACQLGNSTDLYIDFIYTAMHGVKVIKSANLITIVLTYRNLITGKVNDTKKLDISIFKQRGDI